MTKAEKFIPASLNEMREVVNEIACVQSKAAKLLARYTMNGGSTMDGIGAFDFTAYGLTQTEYTEGLTDLATTHNTVGLSTLLSGGAYSKVVKLGNAA